VAQTQIWTLQQVREEGLSRARPWPAAWHVRSLHSENTARQRRHITPRPRATGSLVADGGARRHHVSTLLIYPFFDATC